MCGRIRVLRVLEITGFSLIGVAIGLLQLFLLRKLTAKPRHPAMIFGYIMQRMAMDAAFLAIAWRVGDKALISGAISLATTQIVCAVINMMLAAKQES